MFLLNNDLALFDKFNRKVIPWFEKLPGKILVTFSVAAALSKSAPWKKKNNRSVLLYERSLLLYSCSCTVVYMLSMVGSSTYRWPLVWMWRSKQRLLIYSSLSIHSDPKPDLHIIKNMLTYTCLSSL